MDDATDSRLKSAARLRSTRVDARLVALLNERAQLAIDVGKVKHEVPAHLYFAPNVKLRCCNARPR